MENGVVFEGETKNGQAHGKGVLKNEHFHFVGNWTEGTLNGFGILTLPNGDCFEGEFKNGSPNGNGVWINGQNRFEGTFTNGLPDSQGEITDIQSKNKKFLGLFKNGVTEGKGTQYFQNGYQFQGNYANGKKD